jgi:hypothetical protein
LYSNLLQNRFARTLVFSILLLTVFSCSPTKRVPEGNYLLNRNRIEIQDAAITRSELKSYYRQRPNRRILGFYRFHLQIYNFADGAPSNSITRWMKNTIGEPPVLVNHSLTLNTVTQFRLYMQSKGYFNAEVDFLESEKGKKKNITYTITGNTPYTIRNISYNIFDAHIAGFVLGDTVNSLLKRKSRYDADILHEERNRITRNLRNDGFYRFSRDFIFFEVDSTLASNQVDLVLRLNDPVSPVAGFRDSVIRERHKRFVIDKVMVLPEFSPLTSHIPRADTTRVISTNRRATREHEYIFIHNGEQRINPEVVSNHIMLKTGDYFKISNVENTYSFLADMRNFRYINVQFAESTSPEWGSSNDTLGFLNTTVQLNRTPGNAFTIEAEGLNTAGNLGVASNFLYQNRNIFRGAEIFNLRLKGALEMTGESITEDVFQKLPFNTLELGIEGGLDFPKLLLPIPMHWLSRNSKPQSSIVAGANFRQRPDYTRFILNLNYGFEWNENSRKRHFIYPIEISSVRVYNDSILRANIPQANPFILSRFRDHFILGSKYTYLLNTQRIGRLEDFHYLRVNLESAGNLLSLAARGLDLNKNENNSYTIFNIPFSQFAKADADYRKYRVFNNRQTLVFRIMGGVGVPYGNVNVLPFIKSYYGGGANGVRAWKIYSLGPGSYQSTDRARFDRYGDIKMEMNLEYRFKFYGIWHWAFFMDTGNVWFMNKNEQFPGGEFRLSQLGNDLAIGGGVGLRLDFSFFIVRMDAAVPIKDPAFPFAQQWISSWPRLRDYNLNLGIGYPF